MDIDIVAVLKRAVKEEASDIFIIAGCPLSFKTNDVILPVQPNEFQDYRLTPEDTRRCLEKYTHWPRIARCSRFADGRRRFLLYS